MNKVVIGLIIAVILFFGTVFYFGSKYQPAEEFTWGITFSQTHAQYLGYDWKTMYLDILNDLKPKKIRLMAYWEVIESEHDKYDFAEVAEMLAEAEKRGVEVILVVGQKQPRWPECHHPAWYNQLSQEQKNDAQLNYVRNTVSYYKQFSAIKTWQLENEALFGFGDECPVTDKDLITKELELIRSIDDRPILMTDSGELGRWIPTAKLGPDIFGTTMYRVVHNPTTGYFKYPLPPYFFHVKAGVLKTFTNVDKIIGVELQAEPWFNDDVHRTDLETQYALMNPKILKEYIAYAKAAGFSENYLWGVEWWYWLAHQHGDWGMWQEAKNLLSSN
ncbi:MAG: beta-galactosidase [Candidatus Doudnabacteria bacterium]|nr:beta-galactosidase [Candidatus Doudnabacteria bacterium]